MHTYPAVTADIVIFGIDPKENDLKVCLVQRGIEPFKDQWAIPGGFLRDAIDNSIEQTAIREVIEETGLKPEYIQQFKTYSQKDRDPRGRVVSVAFICLIKSNESLSFSGDASDSRWFSLKDAMVENLAFDHSSILRDAITYLRYRLEHEPIGVHVLPEYFTIPELHKVYEVILDKKIHLSNFHDKILKMNVLHKTEMKKHGKACRPSAVYRFSDKNRI